jgi:hypothetical protein
MSTGGSYARRNPRVMTEKFDFYHGEARIKMSKNDLPTTDVSTTATYADDTVVLTAHKNPEIASHRLQLHLHKIQLWLKKWHMKANETKSVRITFTLKKGHVPPCSTK